MDKDTKRADYFAYWGNKSEYRISLHWIL